MATRTNTVYYFRGTPTGLSEYGVSQKYGYGINSQSVGASSEPAPFHISELTASFTDAILETFVMDGGVSNMDEESVFFTMNNGSNFYPTNLGNTWQPVASSGSLFDTGEHQTAHRLYCGDDRTGLFTFQSFLNASYSFGSDSRYIVTQSYGVSSNSHGLSTKFISTYEYNDSNLVWATKTVRIPIQSVVDRLSTTFQVVGGTGGIPALDTYLPEVSKSYKEIALELICNDAGASAAAFSCSIRIDAAGETYNFTTIQNSLNTARYNYYVYKFNTASFNTSTAHDLYLRSPGLNNRFSTIGGILNVTYRYKASESTTIMNSCVYSTGTDIKNPIPSLGVISFGGTSSYVRDVLINEPSTISVKHVAGVFYTKYAATTGLGISISSDSGSPVSTAYTITAGAIQAGDGCIVHVAPTSSFGNWGRGFNKLATRIHNNTSNEISACWYYIVNYTSGKSTSGVGAHNHTIERSLLKSTAGTAINSNVRFPSTYIIPESTYYLNSAMLITYDRGTVASGTSILNIFNESSSVTQSHDNILIYENAYYSTDAEAGNRFITYALDCHCTKYPQVISDEEFNCNRTNTYLYTTPTATQHAIKSLITYNSISFIVSGTMTGYSGDGNIPYEVYEYGSKEVLLKGTASSGVFSDVWYDDTRNLIVIGRDGTTIRGSNIITAGSSSFVIDFSSTGEGGGEHSFTFIG